MKIEKVYLTRSAKNLVEDDPFLKQAYAEIMNSIRSVGWPIASQQFTINNSEKNVNGVVPLKEACYIMLEEKYCWFREKPLKVLKEEKEKGGPIDVYKEFVDKKQNNVKRVGLEFETGNISSAHRSLSKLLLGLNRKELDLAIIMMPVKALAYYLTDRVANYEELEPYFENVKRASFIFIGFDADTYDSSVPVIPKGPDGMSDRSIKKWKD